MAGRLIVSTIEAQNFKYDSDSPAFSIDSAGALSITQNNAYVDFSSEVHAGVCNSSYNDLDGTTLSSSNATQCNAFAYKISNKLVWLSIYIYKNGYVSGIGSHNTYGWAFKLPNSAVGSSGMKIQAATGYQFIPAGYIGFNGTNYFNAGSIRWQANHSHMLMMYGAPATTNWASAAIELAGCGILHLA